MVRARPQHEVPVTGHALHVRGADIAAPQPVQVLGTHLAVAGNGRVVRVREGQHVEEDVRREVAAAHAGHVHGTTRAHPEQQVKLAAVGQREHVLVAVAVELHHQRGDPFAAQQRTHVCRPCADVEAARPEGVPRDARQGLQRGAGLHVTGFDDHAEDTPAIAPLSHHAHPSTSPPASASISRPV